MHWWTHPCKATARRCCQGFLRPSSLCLPHNHFTQVVGQSVHSKVGDAAMVAQLVHASMRNAVHLTADRPVPHGALAPLSPSLTFPAPWRLIGVPDRQARHNIWRDRVLGLLPDGHYLRDPSCAMGIAWALSDIQF